MHDNISCILICSLWLGWKNPLSPRPRDCRCLALARCCPNSPLSLRSPCAPNKHLAMAIQETTVTDPSLRECLAVGERTRLLCHQILSTIEGNAVTELSEADRIIRSRTNKLLNALMTQLKGLHRTAIMSAREAKETTSEVRREVDRLHLQLQNLYYEQRHLRGEINACREFPCVPNISRGWSRNSRLTKAKAQVHLITIDLRGRISDYAPSISAS